MKQTLYPIGFAILLILVLRSDLLKAETTNSIPLHQPYLSQWLSVDSTHPIHFEFNSNELKNQAVYRQFKFTSDDGARVNGMVAIPDTTQDGSVSKSPRPSKLAVLLHPMGSDQSFWWQDTSPLDAHTLSANLLSRGYVVLSLDARLHGARAKSGTDARFLLNRAHSSEPRVYIDTIIGSVRDYRLALRWAEQEFKTQHTLLMGYSMGAQMALLLASHEPSVDAVVAMVPPFVKSDISPVAPRVHLHGIETAQVLWLAGANDPHSSKEQTQLSFDRIASPKKTLKWFDAGHRLPPQFKDAVTDFVDQYEIGGEQ